MNQLNVLARESDSELLLMPHELIKKHRLGLNLTEEQMASLCDISCEQYMRYETGQRSIYSASFQLGVKMCYYLQLNLNDLFSFEKP